jgi:hypothetical protein
LIVATGTPLTRDSSEMRIFSLLRSIPLDNGQYHYPIIVSRECWYP